MLRKRLGLLLILFLILTASTSTPAVADDVDWEQIAPGIEFRHIVLPDPNNVFIVRMDRSNPSVTLDSTIATGGFAEGKETVSDMFARYDQAINYWGGSLNPPTWGMRNQVVVAINGSYYDLPTGVPYGGQIQSGWYAKRYSDLGGWGGFTWKLDRSVFISECLDHIPEKQFLTYVNTGNTQWINDVNTPRSEHEVVLYTPQWGSRTGTDDSGVEVVVEMTRPTMIMPGPSYTSGIVREIHNMQGNSWIPFNSVVLSGTGARGQALLGNVEIGSEIRFTQEITSYEYDCDTPYDLSWSKAYSSIQGAFFYLKDGQIRDFNDPGAIKRNPRTAIAYNDQYVYFIVVDGRDYYHSVGMSIHELAEFTRDVVGASWGVAQDGGGSSTMVINGKVVNNTYCNNNTCTGNYDYRPVDPLKSTDQSDPASGSADSNAYTGVQRAVANGMIMVIAQPAEYSTAFRIGDPVIASNVLEMRLGPGTNYDVFNTVAAGTLGRVNEQLNGLNGVLAKSANWWYVDFGSVNGWVQQNSLVSPGIEFGNFIWFVYH